jgi:hypothetical protein
MWPQCNEELVAAASAPIATALGVGMSELCIDVWVSASWLTAGLIDKTGYGSVALVIIWVVGGAGQMEAGRGKLDWCAGNLDWSPCRECTLGFRFDFSVLAAARSVGVLAICIGDQVKGHGHNRTWGCDLVVHRSGPRHMWHRDVGELDQRRRH